MTTFNTQAEKVQNALKNLNTLAQNQKNDQAEAIVHATAKLAEEFDILMKTPLSNEEQDKLLSLTASLESTIKNIEKMRNQTKDAILHTIKNLKAQKSYRK